MHSEILKIKDFWREIDKTAKSAKQYIVNINNTVQVTLKSNKELYELSKVSKSLTT